MASIGVTDGKTWSAAAGQWIVNVDCDIILEYSALVEVKPRKDLRTESLPRRRDCFGQR